MSILIFKTECVYGINSDLPNFGEQIFKCTLGLQFSQFHHHLHISHISPGNSLSRPKQLVSRIITTVRVKVTSPILFRSPSNIHLNLNITKICPV
jgi:hypothetical protein